MPSQTPADPYTAVAARSILLCVFCSALLCASASLRLCVKIPIDNLWCLFPVIVVILGATYTKLFELVAN